MIDEKSRAMRKVTPQAVSLPVFCHEEEGGRNCLINFLFQGVLTLYPELIYPGNRPQVTASKSS